MSEHWALTLLVLISAVSSGAYLATRPAEHRARLLFLHLRVAVALLFLSGLALLAILAVLILSYGRIDAMAILILASGSIYFIFSAWSVLGPRPHVVVHALIAHGILLAVLSVLSWANFPVWQLALCIPWVLLWLARFYMEKSSSAQNAVPAHWSTLVIVVAAASTYVIVT